MHDIKILSDNPELESDKIKFDFIAYRNTFVDIITGSQNETPLVIGLESRWGSWQDHPDEGDQVRAKL